jgi:hypothetical protein
MVRPLASVFALGACTLIGSAAPHAAAITGQIGQLWLDEPAVAAHPTLSNVAALSAPDTTFTPGAINYDSTVGGFTISDFLNNPTFSNPSVVAKRDLYSIVILLTGTVALNVGSNGFVLTHDDGVQLFISGIGLVVDEPASTPPVDEVFNVVNKATYIGHNGSLLN